MTQRVSSTMVAKEEEAILGEFRKVLRQANLEQSEARRVKEQLGDFLAPKNLAQQSFARFIEGHRKPYICTQHERIPLHLSGRFPLTVRRTEEVLACWYPYEDWFDKKLRGETAPEEECGEFRVIFVEFHLKSPEIFRRILERRKFRLANFWELAACADYLSRIGRLSKTWLHGEEGLVLRGLDFRAKPVRVHHGRRSDYLGGEYLVRV